MSIKVLFFGATADIVGHREITVSAQPATGHEFLDRLARDYPQLASHKLLMAINQEHATPEAPINDGDEVAIFTPVSGG